MAEGKGARAATIFDVARLAGVSHQTVSRVLNDMPNVKPATRTRVEQAIAQLRYSPSPAARALVTRRTRTIGLVTPGTLDYGPTSIATSFNFAARAARYNVDAVSTPDNDVAAVRTAVEGLLRQRVDALVLIVVDIEVLQSIQGLQVGVPLVAAAATSRPHPLLVSIDQYRGARAATRHLIESGYERILHVAGASRAPDALERVRGWRDEMAAALREVVEPEVGDWSAESGYRIVQDLDVRPGDGLFIANDHMSIGALSALRARGLRVPEDVGVVGFDDLPESPYLLPPLTTVRQDFAALGALMMQKVLVLADEPDRVTEDTPIPTRLVLRESTRPR
ncbi:LacI family transcriptional regulator [Cnuibacter physcomitrellae]|uniref:Transcriptional regulator n=1 Tax=Cnuibacter physcomitrellae TaxID=1619308 RepID=A0A1X9LR68_9MICO|nr:LacI family DNA-binding transcriptional regulator [Cnuibacter physcomitrellae]ARJ06818.1 transcriptional regulator [Cnuibacter physcomitrellae]GGI38906.1 LacI family transcriptional regulator [Cnuibacter physcomitrellae]